MIIKTVIGKGFGGSVNYLMEKQHSEVLHVEGVRMDTPKHMIDDFNFQSSARPDLGNKVWHASISFNHADKPTPELMKQIAEDYCKKFGLDQYAVIRHNDTKHEHFHILGNRVKIDGTTVSDQYSASRGVEQSKILERRYNLEQSKGRDLSKTNTPKLNPYEKAKLDVYKTIKHELQGSKDFNQLAEKLKPHGIEVQPHSNSGGVYGVSFKQGQNCFKGSQLGKDFTAKALEQTFKSVLNLTPIAPIVKVASITKNLGKGMEL